MLPSKSHKHSTVYNNKPLFSSQTVGWAQGYSTFSLNQHGTPRSSRDQAKQPKHFQSCALVTFTDTPLAEASHMTKPTISAAGKQNHVTKGVSVESYCRREELEPVIPFTSAAEKPLEVPKGREIQATPYDG